MNKLGITPGVWVAHKPEGSNGFIYVNNEINASGNIATCYPIHHLNDKEAEANAKLIAEAGTVANETGLSPLQLKEQRDELLELLRQSVEEINKLKYHYRDVKHSDEYLHKATSVINNCENTLNQPPSPHTNNN